MDRERKDRYTFQVSASDSSALGPRSSDVTVTVTVTDVNDNAPVFSSLPFRESIAQSTRIGTSVLQVRRELCTYM